MGKMTLGELNNSIREGEIKSVILSFPNHLSIY